MTSNSRQTRTAGSTDATIAVPANAKTSRALMEAWVEPPLRAPAPSFMEYPHLDIARHGVLENMAPLGTMPSSKVRKLAKTEGPRRVTLVRKGEQSLSAASTPREAVTPEPPVIPARARSESRKMEDSEWNPTTPIAQTSARKGNLRDSASLPPLASPYSTSVSPNKQERELQRTDRIVEYACREAHAAGRIHTGYALRTLYYDHRSNPRIVRLIELVALQEATEEQQNEFRSLMHYKKKEGRTGGKARQWFNSASEKSFPSTPVHFFQVNFGSSPKKAIAEAISDAASRSPHKENNNGHIHKKHKGNNYEVKRERETSCEVNGHGAMNGNHVQSRRSRSRSHSVISSGSELSSLDEELLGQDGMEAILGPSEVSANQTAASDAYTGGPKSETWGGTTDDSHAPAPENLTRPITNPTTLGPILHAWNTSVVPSASSSSTTNTNSQNKSKSPVSSFANHDPHTNNMPALLAEPFSSLTPNPFSSQQPPQHPNLKSLKKAAAGTVRALDENADRTSRLKRKAREITENHAQVLDSFERSQIKPRDPEFEAEGGDTASQRPRSGQVLRFRSSQANKKSNDESEDLSSPTLLSFQQDLAPGSSSNSRAGTPGALSRVARKQKSGLRTKTSPMKKKAGPSAGIPRASGERNSPVGNGTIPQSQDDNDDYCSSCGGNGDLVCCDGCTRSFHFRCVDPPLDDTQLPDSWFCNACFALRNPKPSNDPSLFGQLLAILRKKNPSAFHLPKEIREYFENVRTGTEGEYEEGVVQKPKRNAGYEEAPDYLKLRDAKGNFILCHECHKGAGNGSPIIPCTYCGLNWHLDCLDPPLANPPPIGRAWRCPCHVDDLLAKVPGSLGPAHRFRKIKGASVMRPAFPRGFKNDGHIEVELDPSDDEDEGFYDQKEYGKVYKLPEEGIKLDFISRIYSQVGQTAIPTPPPESMEEPVKQRFTTALRYSILEQQAALNFAQLATQEVAPDGAQLLIDTLISQASPTVVAMIAQGDASNIASNNLGQREKQSLLAMKALIEKSLEQMSGGGDATATEKEQTLKTEEAEDFEMLA